MRNQKNQSSQEKIFKGKDFRFRNFDLKYVLKLSESIPIKKIFDRKFSTLSFFHYFG